MKFCIVSDLHIGIKKSSDIFLKSAEDFFYKQLFPYLKENNINHILILGDVFDTRESVNVKALNFAYDLFTMPFTFTILTGNHDLFYNNSYDLSSLKMLAGHNGVEIIKKPKDRITLSSNLFLAPWIIDQEEFNTAVKNSQSKICLGHFDIDGFVYTGTNPSSKSIAPEVFSKFDKVFSGHLHTRTTKIINNTEIVYVGCPYELTRADIGNTKGFHILDCKTNSYEFIENRVSPKHIQIKYPDIVDESIISKNFIDIFVDEKELDNDKKVKDYLKIFNSNTCLQPPVVKIIKTEDYLTEELEVSEDSKSIIQLIGEYVDIQETLDNKNELKTLLNEIYEEVLV